MTVQCVGSLYRLNSVTAAMLSFVSNGILGGLLLFSFPTELRKYTGVLLCSCAVECLFTMTHLLVDMVGLIYQVCSESGKSGLLQ